MQRVCVLLFFVLSAFVSTVNAQEFRTWKSATGKYSTEATLDKINDDGESVVLKKRNGKTVKVIIAQLSESDQAYIQKNGAKPAKTDPNHVKDEVSNFGNLPTYPFEVALGNTPEEIRSKCEIIEEKYDKVSNWRNFKIKSKNSNIESIEAIFRNEDTLGYYCVNYKNPTRAMATNVYKILAKSFQSPEKFEFNSYRDGEESAGSSIYNNEDGSSAYLSYDKKRDKKELRLSFYERRADSNVPEALKDILYPVAKENVLEILKAPASAVFEPKNKTTYEIRDFGGLFIVYIVVDAQNSYGALLRARYGIPVNYENGIAKVKDISDIIEVKRGEKYSTALLRKILEK